MEIVDDGLGGIAAERSASAGDSDASGWLVARRRLLHRIDGNGTEVAYLTTAQEAEVKQLQSGAPASEGAVAKMHREAAARRKAALSRSLRSLGLDPATAGAGVSLEAHLRPLRGDHIHLSFSIYHKGRLLSPLNDRASRSFTSEGQHVENVFPHFGVHAGGKGWFGDSLIHIHPGTTWQWFSGTEGLGARLGAYLEQAGVLLWEPDSLRYPLHKAFPEFPTWVSCLDSFEPLGVSAYVESETELPKKNARQRRRMVTDTIVASDQSPPKTEYGWGHTFVCSNGEYLWRLYVWRHYSLMDAGKPPCFVLESGFDRLWLPFSGGVALLSYERRNEVPGKISYAIPAEVSLDADGLIIQKNKEAEWYTGFPKGWPDSIARLRKEKGQGFDGMIYPEPFSLST
jgi:hypothetical protein